MKGFEDVVNYLASYTSVGDTLTLTVIRENQEVEVSLTLAERPASR
ncbi:hypothetical protein ACFLWA_10425 [Chloroflexota bacterium]